jgi:hypothetical protein
MQLVLHVTVDFIATELGRVRCLVNVKQVTTAHLVSLHQHRMTISAQQDTIVSLLALHRQDVKVEPTRMK